MSARDFNDDSYDLQPGRQTKESAFSTITRKISGGLEQLAGTIHEKVQAQKHRAEITAPSTPTTASKLTDVGERTAEILHSSASYLKQADFDQMKSDLHTTIKRNPERSLLVGLGVGLLLGGIFRRRG